jgi:hypothetical protein
MFCEAFALACLGQAHLRSWGMLSNADSPCIWEQERRYGQQRPKHRVPATTYMLLFAGQQQQHAQEAYCGSNYLCSTCYPTETIALSVAAHAQQIRLQRHRGSADKRVFLSVHAQENLGSRNAPSQSVGVGQANGSAEECLGAGDTQGLCSCSFATRALRLCCVKAAKRVLLGRRGAMVTGGSRFSRRKEQSQEAQGKSGAKMHA